MAKTSTIIVYTSGLQCTVGTQVCKWGQLIRKQAQALSLPALALGGEALSVKPLFPL